MHRGVHRIGSEVGERSLHRYAVLKRSARLSVVGRKFWRGADYLEGEATGNVECQPPLRVCSKWSDVLATLIFVVNRDEAPGAAES